MTEAKNGSLGAIFRIVEASPLNRSQAAQQAQWFVDHEIAVVPTDGKTPIGGVTAAKLTVDGIKDGYGIALGNGYVAIDFDEHDGATNVEIFKDTRIWRSGSGLGYGIIYRVPVELSNHGGKISSGIAIRAANQIIVGPGSKHPGNREKGIKPGGIYTLVNDIEIQDAPEFIIEYLKTFKDRATAPTNVSGLEKPEWLEKDKNWTSKFSVEIVNGSRSDKTNEIAWYSAERGATNEELAWVISNFEPAKDKYNSHIQDEVKRLIGKIRVKHAHPGFPCDKAECPNKPAWMGKELEVIDLFKARPELEYIKQAADARLVGDKATLLAVLTRAITSVPIEFVLPPIVGSKASLNFFACFVGESGGGKGTATKLAEELFDFKQTGVNFTTSLPASGEGVVSSYLKADNNGWKQIHESVLVNFDEIDQFTATSERNGSTLSATVRQGFMGEAIGGNYSKTVKKLEPHSYRMGFQLSAQPLKSGGFLADSAGGTPQRFVFVQTTNPEIPNIDDLPNFPERLKWKPPQPVLDLKSKKAKAKEPNEVLGKMAVEEDTFEFITIEVDQRIERELKLARIEKLRTGKDAGHLGLTTLKAAFGFAYLNSRMNVTWEDWKLAKVLMSWSKQAIRQIETALEHKILKEQHARTTAAADRAVHIENTLENRKLDRLTKNALNHLKNGVTKVNGRGGLKQKLGRDGSMVGEVISHLVTNKAIKYDETADVVEILDINK